MKRKSHSGIAVLAAAIFLILGFTASSGAQGNGHDQLVMDLRGIAAKAQAYYATRGNSSFTGFSLSASDTGNADGSFSIYNGGTVPTGAQYMPGSVNAADPSSAQTLYIIGCGKTVGKDGINPVKVYVTVKPASITVTELN